MLSHQRPVPPEPARRAALNIAEGRGGRSGAVLGLRTPALLTLAAVGIKTGDLKIHHPSLSLTTYRTGRTMTIAVEKDAGPIQDLALAISLPLFRNLCSSCLVINEPHFL